jgi:hypothetical protein
MNDDPRRNPDDPDPADDPDRARETNDPGTTDDSARDHAAPLPASAADERHAADPVESDESIAGEEDPGAALDEGADDRARKDASQP